MTWDLYVTDVDGTRLALVDPYENAELVARVNDVTTWTVTLPTDTAAGRHFVTEPFTRLEVALDNEVWRSGPVTHLKRDVDLDGDNLTVSGVDDTAWLARRLTHPQPGATAPPYGTTAYDVRTGPVAQVLAQLVDVNAGPGAIPARRVRGLVVPPPGPVGPVVTVSTRWENLLTLLQNTARPHRLMFDVVDLALRVYPSADRGAVFSAGLETLSAWSMTSEAPATNYVFVAGQGEGTARLIREQSDTGSIDTWGRFEAFVDQRQTMDVAEMDKAAAEALAAGVKPVTVVFSPVDTDAQRFGRDWALGDTVTVKAGGLTVIDQVREVHVTLDDAGATVTPSVGQPAGDLALFRSLAGLDRRVRQLERI